MLGASGSRLKTVQQGGKVLARPVLRAGYTPSIDVGYTPQSWSMLESSPVEKELATLFAQILRARRHELGLSQEQVALRANIDRNHYQLMESARSDSKTNKAVNPRLYTLMRLADALEMPVEDLLHSVSEGYDVIRAHGQSLNDQDEF